MRLKNVEVQIADVIAKDARYAVVNNKLQELRDIRVTILVDAEYSIWYYTAKVDDVDVRLNHDTKFYLSADNFKVGKEVGTNNIRLVNLFAKPFHTKDYGDNTFRLLTWVVEGCEVKEKDVAAGLIGKKKVCITLQYRKPTQFGLYDEKTEEIEPIDTSNFHMTKSKAQYYCSFTERDAEGNETYHPCLMDKIKPTEEQMSLVKELEELLARMDKANVRLVCDRDDCMYYAVNGNNLHSVSYDEPDDMTNIKEVWDAVCTLPSIKESNVIQNRWNEDGVFFKI